METDFSKKDIAGVLFQYPDTDGSVDDYSRVVEEAKKFGVNPIISRNWGRKNRTQLVWSDLAKFRHFSIIVKPFGHFWLLIKYLAKNLLTYFSKFCMLLGKLSNKICSRETNILVWKWNILSSSNVN